MDALSHIWRTRGEHHDGKPGEWSGRARCKKAPSLLGPLPFLARRYPRIPTLFGLDKAEVTGSSPVSPPPKSPADARFFCLLARHCNERPACRLRRLIEGVAVVVVAVERRLHVTDQRWLVVPRPICRTPRHVQVPLHPHRQRGAVFGRESDLLTFHEGRPPRRLPQECR